MEKPKSKPKTSNKTKTESNKINDYKNQNKISPTKYNKFPINNIPQNKTRNKKRYGSTDLKNATTQKTHTTTGSTAFSISPNKKKNPTNFVLKNIQKQQGMGLYSNMVHDRINNSEKTKILNTTMSRKIKNDSFHGKNDTNLEKLKSFEKNPYNKTTVGKKENNIPKNKNKNKNRGMSPAINRDLLNVKQNSIFNYSIDKSKKKQQNNVIPSPFKKNNKKYNFSNMNFTHQKKSQISFIKYNAYVENKTKNKNNDKEYPKSAKKVTRINIKKNNEVKSINDKNINNIKEDNNKKATEKKVDENKNKTNEKNDENKNKINEKIDEKKNDDKPTEEQKLEEKPNEENKFVENNNNNVEEGDKLENAAGNLVDDMFSNILGDGINGESKENNNKEINNNKEENNKEKEEEKIKVNQTKTKKKTKKHIHNSKSQADINPTFIPKLEESKTVPNQQNDKKPKDYESKKITLIDTICKKGFAGPGVKKINQDNFFIHKNFLNNENYLYLGVCDGHGMIGQDVSGYLRTNLPITLQNAFLEDNTTDLINTELYIICKSINKIFTKTQEDLVSNDQIDTKFSGSTCCTLIYTPERLITANVGDSRCVIGKTDGVNWYSQNLTKDHKPTLPNEKKRIEANGGMVEPCKEDDGTFVGPDRVWIKDEKIPGLAMSRSFGDETAHMVGVIAEPEILDYYFLHEDKFIMIASDGIWEFISSDECVKIVKDYYLKNDLEGALNFLYKESSKRWIMEEEMIDDITLILVFLE